MLLRSQVSEAIDEHIDMTPMVDVVFQLMTFMLFSMQIGGGDSLSIPPARHGVGVDENEAVFLTILPARNPADRPRIQIGTVNPESVDIDRACRAVSDGVAKGLSRVVLLADGQVPHGEMLGIISEITKRESGATIHIGVKDPE